MKSIPSSTLVLLLASGSALALDFNFTEGAGITALRAGDPGQQQLANDVVAGFTTAAGLWSSQLTNNFTFRLSIDYKALGPGVLGQAGSDTVGVSYANTRNALISRATSSNDLTSVASLPSSSISFVTNDRAGNRITDNDGSANNSILDITRANAKALGFLASGDLMEDTSITFSSNFSFDFNRADGIAPGSFDFIGVATHEIGHGLGFVSGVDVVDSFSGPNGGNKDSDLNGTGPGIGTLDPFRVFSVLDLFRYGAAGTRDLAYGGTPYFSIDGGTTNDGLFSTGAANGDGAQASHWKDNLNLGLMDPTTAPGERIDIQERDLNAMDVIGYNVVPEPGSLTLIGTMFGLAGFGWVRRSMGKK